MVYKINPNKMNNKKVNNNEYISKISTVNNNANIGINHCKTSNLKKNYNTIASNCINNTTNTINNSINTVNDIKNTKNNNVNTIIDNNSTNNTLNNNTNTIIDNKNTNNTTNSSINTIIDNNNANNTLDNNINMIIDTNNTNNTLDNNINMIIDTSNTVNDNINTSIIQTTKDSKKTESQRFINDCNPNKYKQFENNDNINTNINKSVKTINNKNYNTGHRQRVINKLNQNGFEQFNDYEIVELMLFLIFKRKDTKLIAKKLLEKFKNLDSILNAPEEDLITIAGIGKSTCNAFKIINSIIKFSLKSKIINKNIIICFNDVINYIKVNMQNLANEEVRLLLLNGKNAIIDDIVIQKGSIDSVEIYPQEILKHCINRGAKSIILVHNHPSGDPTPSTHDIYITNKIQEATDIFNITLFDHIIIGENKYTSFRSLKLLKD